MYCFVNKTEVRLWNKWKATTSTTSENECEKKEASPELSTKGWVWWNETNTKINNNFIALCFVWWTLLLANWREGERVSVWIGWERNATYLQHSAFLNDEVKCIVNEHLRIEKSFAQKESDRDESAASASESENISSFHFLPLACIANYDCIHIIKCLNLFSFCRIVRHVT